MQGVSAYRTMTPVPRLAAPPAPVPAAPAPAAARTPRQERVGAFLRDAQASALEQTRYITSVWMGQMVGTTLGTAIMGPIGLAVGNLFVITGGVSVASALGALAGYAAEKHHWGTRIKQAIMGKPAAPAAAPAANGKRAAAEMVGGLMSGAPNFIYPAIHGATPAERELIMKAMDAMPMHEVATASHITVAKGLENMGASGLTVPTTTGNHIWLGRDSLGDTPFGYGTIIHEQGHAIDFSQGIGPFGTHSAFGPWGKPPWYFDPSIDYATPKPYASTNRFEDFAQTHMAYYTDPHTMQTTNAAKYAVMDQVHHGDGLWDRVVDQPAVRHAGQAVGKAMEMVPGLRTSLDLTVHLIAPAIVHKGARHLQEGIERNNALQRFHGKMSLATGLSYLFRSAVPFGMATSLAHLYYSRRIAKNRMSVDEADRKANGFLAVSMGPVGTSGLAVLETLRQEGLTSDNGPRTRAMPMLVKGIGGAMVGAYAGGFVGTLIGTSVAGVGGAFLGSTWGNLAGATLGLAAGIAHHKWKNRGAHAAGVHLTRGDKLHLAAVGGGAVLGGVAGTVAGYAAGNALGSALGGALAGPTGALIGSIGGRALGVLALSYAGARLGAKAGSKVAPDDGT